MQFLVEFQFAETDVAESHVRSPTHSWFTEPTLSEFPSWLKHNANSVCILNLTEFYFTEFLVAEFCLHAHWRVLSTIELLAIRIRRF